MGAYLSEPMTQKESEDGEGNKLRFGACSMQGWRVSQEDAHNCIAQFDKDSSLFAVYDGHGGAEVAIYLSKHLPDTLKACVKYQNGEFDKALEECYLKIDASIKTPEVLKEIQLLAKKGEGDSEAMVDYEEENVGALYEEATMPLDKLVAKYSHNQEEGGEEEMEEDCKPGSSRAIAGGSGAGMSSSSSCSSSSSAGKVNGDEGGKEEEVEAGGSSSKVEVQEEKVNSKTEGDEVDAGGSNELIVEGKKIELEVPTVAEEKPVVINGDNEVPSKSAENGTEKPVVNGNNGESEAGLVVISKETEETPTTTPRRKKVHPVLIGKPESPEEEKRSSPRKSGRPISFVPAMALDSEDDSEEDEEDNAGYNMGDDSDDDDDDEDDEEDLGDDSDEEDDDEDEEEEEDERFLSEMQEPGYDSGATAVVCFMKWQGEALNLWVANAGDSRCVVCRDGQAVEMSHDHKPELDIEAQRIVKAGGKVTEDGRVNGGLNLSRALGDHSYKQNPDLPPEEQMISPLPTVLHLGLKPEQDRFMVLACDGIWNSMSSQEVVDFVAERLNKEQPLSKICEELFDTCLASDTCGDGTGCDNMTCIIVQLPGGGNSEQPEIYSGSKRKLSLDTEPVIDQNNATSSPEDNSVTKKAKLEPEAAEEEVKAEPDKEVVEASS